MNRGASWAIGLVLLGACGRGVWGDPGQAYSDLDDATKWSTFDVSTVNPAARGYLGGVYDGRYVYLVPYDNGAPHGGVSRYDTSLAFDSSAAWSFFDVGTVDAKAKQFAGAAFDGRFVYLVPLHGVAPRYDTHAAFDAASSWSTFDVTSVTGGANAFATAAFDGRRVYFSPWSVVEGVPDGLAVSYDTQGDFDAPAAWSAVDLSALDAAAIGLGASLFDGRYLYEAPASGQRAVFARHDTQAPFASLEAWTAFDLVGVDGRDHAINGAAFDGRYAYFAPLTDGRMVRCDTRGAFGADTTWATFDVATLDARATGFSGASFDGRYVYFGPYGASVASGIVVRGDTQSAFTSPGSWSTFDLTTIAAGAKGFSGTVFDGRYLYLVPNMTEHGASGMVARFDARVPPLPGGPSASFF